MMEKRKGGAGSDGVGPDWRPKRGRAAKAVAGSMHEGGDCADAEIRELLEILGTRSLSDTTVEGMRRLSESPDSHIRRAADQLFSGRINIFEMPVLIREWRLTASRRSKK